MSGGENEYGGPLNAKAAVEYFAVTVLRRLRCLAAIPALVREQDHHAPLLRARQRNVNASSQAKTTSQAIMVRAVLGDMGACP